MKKYLQVGKIINTHGLKGELKVIPLTDDASRFNDLTSVYIVASDTIESDVVIGSIKMEITNVKYQKEKVIIKFKGIDLIEEAEKLKQAFLVIPREAAVKLPEDHYFICDLIGCEVSDEGLGYLGNITEVFQTGSNDVYVVKNSLGKEILIPVIKSVVTMIDIDNKKVSVCLPEGL